MLYPEILAVIPARKNSKGIKNKNILKINNNMTLIEYTFKFVKSLNFITEIVFTSDSKFMIIKDYNDLAQYNHSSHSDLFASI
mgnify:CR=1 FL=1